MLCAVSLAGLPPANVASHAFPRTLATLQVREGHLSIVKQLVGHSVLIRNDAISMANNKARFSNNPDRHKIKDYLNFVSKVRGSLLRPRGCIGGVISTCCC